MSYQLETLLADYLHDLRPETSGNRVGEAGALPGLSLAAFLKDRLLVARAVNKGLPFPLYDEIQKRTPFGEMEWADLLNLSPKSLQRYRMAEEHIFKPIHTEKILEVAEVMELGKEVFEDTSRFENWLYSEVRGLGGHRPVDLLRNSYGQGLVLEALHRIDQGVFA